MSDYTDADIHIVGAGLSGALLAVLLAKQHGIKVALFESRNDLRINTLSAGKSINLALARRGLDALAAAGLSEQVLEHVVPMYGRQLHALNGKQQFVGYSKDLNHPIYSLSRSKLNEILLNAAEKTGLVSVYFDHACTNVDVDNNIVEFNNDIKLSYRICVGADGFASKVRAFCISDSDVSIEPLKHSYKELTMPSKNGDYQMSVNALHIWPRGEYMLIALPNSSPSYTVTLFLPDEEQFSLSNFNTKIEVENFFIDTFPDVLPLIPDLTNQFFDNPIGKLATIRCTKWHNKNTILIGDAAHAIVPFQGQGMNCAFEDALCFSELYSELENNFNVFADRFVQLRKNNANAIADMALENYIEMRDTVATERYHTRKKIAWILQERYPDQFIPRYNMIMFENIPYAKVKQLGIQQEIILDKLIGDLKSINDLDFNLADRLIGQYAELC